MSWIEETKLKYVNKGPQVGIRTYTYEFREKWWHRFMPFRSLQTRQFDTNEISVNGDSNGHRMVLANPDFEINGHNVVEWCRATISQGRVHLCFTVTYEVMSGTDPLTLMEARFSDRRLATLFKLTFG